MPGFDRRVFERRSLLILAGSTLAVPALAQSFPARPIRLWYPLPAGGPTDVYARFYAERMTANSASPW